MKKDQREADILRDCLTWLRLPGVFCWRQNQGAITGQYHGKRRFLRFTSVDGVSDILGVLRPQGLLLALEVKRPGRRPTPKQEAFLATVRDHGGIGACVQSVAELEQMFPTWCPPLP
jgi:VRR-NUC domain